MSLFKNNPYYNIWNFFMGNKRKNEDSPTDNLKKKEINYNMKQIEQWAKGDGNCLDLTPYLNDARNWRRNEVRVFGVTTLFPAKYFMT